MGKREEAAPPPMERPAAAGDTVKVLALDCQVEPDSLEIGEAVEVRL